MASWLRFEELPPFDPKENFYSQDLYHMGQDLGTNITAMFASHSTEKMKYLILVNRETGERVKIVFAPS